MRGGGRLLPRGGAVACAVPLLACTSCFGSSTEPTPPPPAHSFLQATTPSAGLGTVLWSISAIDAVFGQDCFCTSYAIAIAAPSGVVRDNDVWTVTWTIKLTLVDKPSAPDPSTPGSGAAVDSGCDNHGTGTTSPAVHDVHVSGTGSSDQLVWHHPDAAADPTGYYHCDHTLQGPHGHQGLITVTVNHGVQTCVAHFDGTHTGKGDDPDQPGPPECTKS